MKHSTSIYFSIQGVLFPGGRRKAKSLNLEVNTEGSDLVETFSAGLKEISSYRYPDATVRNTKSPLKYLKPRPLTDKVPDDLAPYVPKDRNSSFALFRVTMMSHLISSKKNSYAPVLTQIDMLLDVSGVGAYRICSAKDEILFELGPFSVSHMPIAVMMTVPPWLPEFLKAALIAFALWKIKAAAALVVVPTLSIILMILAILALVAFIVIEISNKTMATGGLTPAQNAALQSALRLKKMAEQRKEAIENIGRDLTPDEVQEVQDMLTEITNTANDLGETLNPDSEDAEKLKEISEGLEQLKEDLKESLPE